MFYSIEICETKRYTSVKVKFIEIEWFSQKSLVKKPRWKSSLHLVNQFMRRKIEKITIRLLETRFLCASIVSSSSLLLCRGLKLSRDVAGWWCLTCWLAGCLGNVFMCLLLAFSFDCWPKQTKPSISRLFFPVLFVYYSRHLCQSISTRGASVAKQLQQQTHCWGRKTGSRLVWPQKNQFQVYVSNFSNSPVCIHTSS